MMWVKRYIRAFVVIALIGCAYQLLAPAHSAAITALPTPSPGSGSYGLEATKKQPPPTQGATITIPGNGSSASTSPITVSGICPNDLLVQVYDNNVLVGSVNCQGGSFSIQVTLFSGTNDLTATVFDDLDQAGPVSNKVTVTYNNANFTAFGALITLTSNYGRRAANPNATLTWPLLLSGGAGPYAFSIDWGDGTALQLKSQAAAGEVDISHIYAKSGIYHVIIKVTDANGATAYLQVIAVANGNVGATSSTANTSKATPTPAPKVIWLPAAVGLLLLLPTYWLGRRSQLHTLHNRLAKEAANYKEE